jgi:hypothetical protein
MAHPEMSRSQMAVLKCPVLKCPILKCPSSNSHPQMSHPQVLALNCRHAGITSYVMKDKFHFFLDLEPPFKTCNIVLFNCSYLVYMASFFFPTTY